MPNIDIVGVLALLISAYLAWLRFRDTRAKPDLRLDMDWMVGGGGPSVLTIVATNRGKARGGVRPSSCRPATSWMPPPASPTSRPWTSYRSCSIPAISNASLWS